MRTTLVPTTLIQVPYDLGRDGGMGAGVPVLAETLADLADDTVVVAPADASLNETAACLEIVRGVREQVRDVGAADRFPLVLAGNCHSSLGTVAGLGIPVGVVWLDAHADFNTPETTSSGFLDGMALALLTGSGWAALRATIAGHVPVPVRHVVLAGARDLDSAEEQRLTSAPVLRAQAADLNEALDTLRERVSDVYLHVDLDVLDPSVGRANRFACDGGFTLEELELAVDAVQARFTVCAAAVTAYDPDEDPDGAIPPAARAIVLRLLAARALA
ncbi:MAG: arginase family protein [Gaiellaceae bacterium MAG52_C11]|nr:arginase family protein [Candidatus Gaiellasilicea maunaloa]